MSRSPSIVDAQPAFEYPLTALLRQRSLELDCLKEELARVSESVASRARALAVQAAQIQVLEDTQRHASQSGVSIDVSWRLRLHDCVRIAQARHAECVKDVQRANAEQELTIEKVRLARLALSANERHLERATALFRHERQRAALRAADEQYLAAFRPDNDVGSGAER